MTTSCSPAKPCTNVVKFFFLVITILFKSKSFYFHLKGQPFTKDKQSYKSFTLIHIYDPKN